MYIVSSPYQDTKPCQKPQPYQELLQPCQELVDHIQMCARKAHYPNMQLIQFGSSRKVDIHIILAHCCTLQPFYLDIIDLYSYKPSVACTQSSLKISQCHQQRVTVCHMSFIIYRIIISHQYHLISLSNKTSQKIFFPIPNILVNSSLVSSHNILRVSSSTKILIKIIVKSFNTFCCNALFCAVCITVSFIT